MTTVVEALQEFSSLKNDIDFTILSQTFGDQAAKLEVSVHDLSGLIAVDVERIGALEDATNKLDIASLDSLFMQVPQLKDYQHLMDQRYEVLYSAWMKTAQLLVNAMKFVTTVQHFKSSTEHLLSAPSIRTEGGIEIEPLKLGSEYDVVTEQTEEPDKDMSSSTESVKQAKQPVKKLEKQINSMSTSKSDHAGEMIGQ